MTPFPFAALPEEAILLDGRLGHLDAGGEIALSALLNVGSEVTRLALSGLEHLFALDELAAEEVVALRVVLQALASAPSRLAADLADVLGHPVPDHLAPGAAALVAALDAWLADAFFPLVWAAK